jgi:UPF0755 protein
MKKKALYLFLLLLLVCAFFAYRFYNYIFQANVQIEQESIAIYIPTDGTMDDLVDSLVIHEAIVDTHSFRWVADKMKFTKPKSGKYLIQNGFSNKDLIGMLRSGRQTPVKLTFNNLRHIQDVAGAISEPLEADSLSLYNYFTSEKVLSKTGLNLENIITLFIPNTYEIYWDASPEEIVNRFIKENKKFWTKENLSKADALGLSKEEVYTLASIVQKETNLNSEKPTIAGIYLNRLKKGILLQADPTVVFGVGDFTIRRVLNKHLEYDSPYNTYLYEGLPPGPIFMPDISTLNGVLNAEEHNYLYFCASPGYNGKHQFAKTLAQHNANARKYHNWLNKERIFK